MAVSMCVSSKSSTWELMPFNKAACRMSVRSGRPNSVAWSGPKNGESAAMTLVTVWWRAPPMAQPTQLSSVRAPSCRTVSGRSSKRDETMNRASLRVASWDGSESWPGAPVPAPASRDDALGSESLMVSLFVRWLLALSNIYMRHGISVVLAAEPGPIRRNRSVQPCRPLSIHTQPGCLDRPGPFLDLAHDELSQVFRRAALRRHHLDAELLEPGLHVRAVHGGHGRVVELLDDRGRRALWQENGVPGVGFEIRQALLMRGR